MTNPSGQELNSGRDLGQQRSLTSGQMAWFRFRSNPSSIIGAFIFFPIGLNLSPYLGYSASLIVGIFIFIFQLYLNHKWFQSYKQGPLEKIWHKATWIGHT